MKKINHEYSRCYALLKKSRTQVILLDTHIWIWWVHNDSRLTDKLRGHIQAHEDDRIGVSIFSCWEVAKLVELGKLT